MPDHSLGQPSPSDSIPPDPWREAAVPALTQHIDGMLRGNVGAILAPELLDLRQDTAAEVTERVLELSRDGVIPRGIILKRGQADQLAAAVRSAKLEASRSLGTEIHFLFAEHGTPDDARWTAAQIREITARDPRSRYHLVLEAMVPETVPADLPTLVSQYPELTVKNENLAVLDDVARGAFPNPALRVTLEQRYATAVQALKTIDATQVYRDRGLAATVTQALSFKGSGPNDFHDWDGQFRMEMCSLAEQGIQFRVSDEIAPFSCCVRVLRADCLQVMARITALRGNVPGLLQMLAAAYLDDHAASRERDKSLVDQLKAGAYADPAERIIVCRGISHRNYFSGTDWGKQIKSSIVVQPGGRLDLDQTIDEGTLQRIFATGSGPPEYIGRLGRIFLRGEIGSTLGIDFGVSKLKVIQVCDALCHAVSDDCGLEWLTAVVSKGHNSHPDLLRSTASFLQFRGGANTTALVAEIRALAGYSR